MEMKMLNLSELEIDMLDGSVAKFDVSKELAQVIFQNTQSINEHALAMAMYKDPIVELTPENEATIRNYTTSDYFKAFVTIAVIKTINELKEQV